MPKRDKVTLGGPARPEPTRVYVRQKQGEELGSMEPLPSHTRVRPPAAPSPPTEGGRGAGVPAGAPAGTHVHVREGRGEQEDSAGGDAEHVLACWRRLPEDQRRRCLAVMSLELRRGRGQSSAEKELWSEAVHEALAAALGPSDGSGHGVQVVRGIVGAPGAWAPIAEFLESSGLLELDRTELNAVFGLLARLLVARARRVAQRADIPLTPKLVASNAQHIAGIVDNAYPGYASQPALMRFVARQVVLGNRSILRGGERRAGERL